ncbi:MAG: ferritin-like domain-containing protein [Anaerolineae bacterium]
MDLVKVYEYALQREYEGRDFFNANAAKMGSQAAVGIFKKLAAEEEKHITFISDILTRVRSGQTTAGVDEPLPDQTLFGARAASEQIDQTVIESMTPDVTILRMAYLIERDFAEFYEMTAAKAEGDAKEALQRLAAWERGHEKLFKELHDRVYEEYMQMPWGG